MAARKTIVQHRRMAFIRQGGLCFYCQQPMWERGVESAFNAAARLGLPWSIEGQRELGARFCTAEHLVPRREKGSNRGGNIVAACLRCNAARMDRTPDVHGALMAPEDSWFPVEGTGLKLRLTFLLEASQ